MKKVLVSFAAAALAGSLFTSAVLAKSPNAKESLIALGDSITFGYNLGINNQQPSKDAFPYLIDNDEKDFRVNNLGVPGWRSDQLLDALTNDQKFRQAVRHADVVTLDIGSNDLLQGLKTGSQQALQNAISTMFSNLNASIATIRSLTDAPIVVYNIYNPFQTNDPLHMVGDNLLPGINGQILLIINKYKIMGDQNIVLADAYSAYGDNQVVYVRKGDIHPTVEGQQVLADLAELALGLQ